VDVSVVAIQGYMGINLRGAGTIWASFRMRVGLMRASLCLFFTCFPYSLVRYELCSA